jgi:hypothetical protein
MPLDEKDMDKVFDLKCKYFLKKMEVGKFYSYDELKTLVTTNSVHRLQLPLNREFNESCFRHSLC